VKIISKVGRISSSQRKGARGRGTGTRPKKRPLLPLSGRTKSNRLNGRHQKERQRCSKESDFQKCMTSKAQRGSKDAGELCRDTTKDES